MSKQIEMVANMRVCYVPLPLEREQAWRAATLLLLKIIYPAICHAPKVDPAPTYIPADIQEI